MKLADYLRAEGLSQAAFARRLGVSPQVVHRLVSGARDPSREVLRAIVAATGGAVAPNDFFDLPPAGGTGAGGVLNAPLARAADEAA